MTRSSRSPSLAHLPTFDDDDNVIGIIETRQGTRTKLAFDEATQAFTVKKVLPEGMSFPFDFGFIPSTLGDDGDPLDVLVLMDEAVPTGTAVPLRLIGVIEARQTEEDGETDENDRLIGIACANDLFRDVKRLSALPGRIIEQIEHFFVSYNQEDGKQFEPIGRHGRKRATNDLKTGMRRFRRKHSKR